MTRRIAKIALLAICALMTAWLVRYEAFPGFFADDFAGYRSLYDGGILHVDRWTKISHELI